MSGQAPSAPNASELRTAVAAFVSSLPPGRSRLLVALSGGPDSVALLASVARASGPPRNVVACWVDHAIRPEAELAAEEEFVRSLCSSLGVDLVVARAGRGDIEHAAASEGGVEAAARKFRYAALEKARADAACDIVLTGHTADDLMETMIMRFCSGAGTGGLRGIPAANGKLRRPLLGVAKSSVYAYLAEEGLAWRVDSTNEADDYLRNRIRHDVMPTLLSVFPSLRAALETSACKARLDEEALAGFAETLASRDAADNRPLDAAAFDKAPAAVRIRALYGLAGAAGRDRLPWRLVAAAAASRKAEGRLASGAGIQFVRREGLIALESADGSHGSRPLADETPAADAPLPGFSVAASGMGEFRIGKAGVCRIYSSESPPGLRTDSFSWPICVRSRRNGDTIVTSGGRKTVDSLVSELGIPVSLRAGVIVVEDRNGVVAALASRCGGRDIYRRNDSLAGVPASGYLVLDLKGAAFTDAV